MIKGLTKDQALKLKEIANKFSLDLLILFGSRAKGNNKKNSDFDLAFWKKSDFHIEDEINIFDEIGDILGEKPFDLVNLEKNHNVILRQQIFQYGKCLYESQKRLFEKEKEYAYFDYIDSFALLNPTKDKFLSGEL